ncbi:MAG TPA: hypothetical protein VJM31_17265 [Vicinamibacterales bacterium]|nr:hypothetical protein [Vicinamibacterales bacterium]
MTDSMTSIDRMAGAAVAVVSIFIAYWAGISDWRLLLVSTAAMAGYQLGWVRGRQSTISATN